MSIQTIQATGKKYKLLKRVGGWLAIIGLFVVGAAEEQSLASASILLIGLSLYVWGRIGKWWHHE